jgi:hypothetical protein
LVAVLMLAALLWKETETSGSTASISPSIKLYVGALCSGKGHGVDEVLLAGRGGEGISSSSGSSSWPLRRRYSWLAWQPDVNLLHGGLLVVPSPELVTISPTSGSSPEANR